MPRCQSCGRDSPEGFRFCGACGAELGPWVTTQERRKTVTVLFCDVTGSTALGEQLDPESLRRTMGRYFEEIRRIVERHGGTVEKFIGDAVMAVFGVPLAHEDDALRAVRAAGEIRERIVTLGEELGVTLFFRTGVNTGEVVAGEGETLVTGDAVNVAARLEQAAAPGEILVGAGTLLLVRDAVVTESAESLSLKGKRDPVVAHRLVSVDFTAEAVVRHLDAPLVGRVRERERLRTDFEAAVSERVCRLFTVLGPAGVGKSRLVAEFLADVEGNADVLRARCLHYGEDITYWPLVEILLRIGVEPETVIGSSPANTQLSFRRLLEARASKRPQIVLLDDIQWAEGVFLDLVEYVADWSRGEPIFLLCVARPELLERRSGWGAGSGWGRGKLNATTLALEPLRADDCEALIDWLAGELALGRDIRARILAAADGNPLFLEEMVAMVTESGDQEEIVVPPTIQALLQARLDRLGVGERDVVGCGAVEGQVFHRGVVQELAPEDGRGDVPTHLRALVRKEVVRPDRATFAGDDAFRFRHLLIRDAAYDALPKETRAELHERFADWLEQRTDLVELDEIAGYHLEQAHASRAALDPADARLDVLARRAAGHLARAAEGARARGDVRAVGSLFGRALALFPSGSPERYPLLIERFPTLTSTGQFDLARETVAELKAASDEAARAWGELADLHLGALTGVHDDSAVQAGVDECRPVMESLGDEWGLATVEWLQYGVYYRQMRSSECVKSLDRVLDHATRAGRAHAVRTHQRARTAMLLLGPAHFDDVLPVLERDVAEAQGPVELITSQAQISAVLVALGRSHEARAVARAFVEACRDAGTSITAAAASTWLSFIEMRAGDLDAAEQALREGAADLEALGERAYYSTVACSLAEVLLQRGADEEAARWCAKARGAAVPADPGAIAHVDAVEGVLAAGRGEFAEGERLARRGMELIAESDFYDLAARIRLLLARTLVLCGKPDEARGWATEALTIYEAKGDQPAAGWVRSLLDELG